METPLLAAALIVKNEEKFLPDCIASLNELRPLLSEICIYDTGSTDRTVEIARAAGARVEQGYWDDDFARARNAAVAMCNAKWVLNIDADERIRADQAKLRTVLRDGLTSNLVGIDALEIEIRNLDPDGDPVSSFRVRRFLRPGRAEYHGVVHETIGALRDGKLTCWPLASDVLYYDHIGYEHGTMPVKGSRNLELAELDVAHNGDGADVDLQLTALLNRARSFMTLGKWADAVDDYVKIWKVKSDAPRRIWAMQDLAELLVQLGAYDDAAVIARELSADGRYPDIAALLMARARMGQGRHREALELLRRVDNPHNAIGFSTGTTTTIEARMIAAANCGELDEAAACCIQLFASHGVIPGRGRLLLKLWGDRSAGDLADLLVEDGSAHVPAMMTEFESLGASAAAVLQALRARTGSPSAPSGRQGASVGSPSLFFGKP
ncbi:MAG: glycosyltransferase family 2 protein [Austwickia sp.]|nr:glycosyltransferase family 2 protein [Austwickia sp.]